MEKNKFFVPLFILALSCCSFFNVRATTLKVQFKNLEFNIVHDHLDFFVRGIKNTTNSDGFLQFDIPDSFGLSFAITLAGRDRKVLFPSGGNVLVPKDKFATVDLIIGSDKDYATLISIYPLIVQMLKKGNIDCEKFVNEIKKLKEDSVLIIAKRDSAFSIISRNLNGYINKAMNLYEVLAKFDTGYFLNPAAVAFLDTSIVHYNREWDLFYFNKDQYVRSIEKYWLTDAALSADFKTEVNDITQIHYLYFKSFNEIFGEINKASVMANAETKRNSLKAALIKLHNEANFSRFKTELNLLQSKTNVLNQKLSH